MNVKILLLLSTILFANKSLKSQPASPLDFDIKKAEYLYHFAYECIDQEYPNKLGQVLGDDSYLAPPRVLHPAFYGCFDWHSSVHGHWTLVTILSEFPDFEYHNEIFETRLLELVELEGEHPGAWLRAYAKASIEQIEDPDNVSLYVSLFAAEERYDSAHRLMRDKYIAWQKRIDESRLDPDWAMLIRFAVDGLWFAEIHRYAPPNKERRDRIVKMILDLTR